MSKDLLLEIGTEEIPAHAMPGILSQLKENAAKAFKELRLSYTDIRTLGTPRRTALLVAGPGAGLALAQRMGLEALWLLHREGALVEVGLGRFVPA